MSGLMSGDLGQVSWGRTTGDRGLPWCLVQLSYIVTGDLREVLKACKHGLKPGGLGVPDTFITFSTLSGLQIR